MDGGPPSRRCERTRSHLKRRRYNGRLRDACCRRQSRLFSPDCSRRCWRAWAHRRNFLDIPNHRSSHVVATPRIGGVALVTSVVAGAVACCRSRALASVATRRVVLTGAVAIAALGLADDFWTCLPSCACWCRRSVAAMRRCDWSARAVQVVRPGQLDADGAHGLLDRDC